MLTALLAVRPGGPPLAGHELRPSGREIATVEGFGMEGVSLAVRLPFGHQLV
jgi:hypothetical protein